MGRSVCVIVERRGFTHEGPRECPVAAIESEEEAQAFCLERNRAEIEDTRRLLTEALKGAQHALRTKLDHPDHPTCVLEYEAMEKARGDLRDFEHDPSPHVAGGVSYYYVVVPVKG